MHAIMIRATSELFLAVCDGHHRSELYGQWTQPTGI